ncbi:hypothetical protein TrLO_g4994 [Triparma laevis f. longispina]|uniref:Uncharacterized protein n=1 Tax=Triparma laevis f. longispina TaxID=1714387 RepID=A0A9W7ACN6_9STRA|nr:hypothetical protein TrLO_g4994 [Triparma laevis f. longispina]
MKSSQSLSEPAAAAALGNSTTVSTVPTSYFLNSVECRRKLLEYFSISRTLRLLSALCTEWRGLVEVFPNYEVTQVIFLLNITKIGDRACTFAANLVVVDIPKGVKSIGYCAFYRCTSLTNVSFPTTLTLIGGYAFARCPSLENVDLLHTNLQQLGEGAFYDCSELTSMTIPDSLQTLKADIFVGCHKLVPASIDVNAENANLGNDVTFRVVAFLRRKQKYLGEQKERLDQVHEVKVNSKWSLKMKNRLAILMNRE